MLVDTFPLLSFGKYSPVSARSEVNMAASAFMSGLVLNAMSRTTRTVQLP